MIRLTYGDRQAFRFRHRDVNILGNLDATLPLKKSVYQLNGGLPVHFYVEPEPKPGGKKYPWGTKTPSVHRLRNRVGHFNIEIPIDCPKLQTGLNQIVIQIEDIDGKCERIEAEFSWDPCPLALPLNLQDLSRYQNIQDVGQVVNGAFDLDRERNAICSRMPVGSDSLLLLGSPHDSQEATYNIKFRNIDKEWCFVGASDFFAGHLEQSPDLGIKPGYCTSGLATIDRTGRVQIWMAWGDCLMDKDRTWVIRTEKKIKFPIQPNILYNVRHQVIISEGISYSRFRIWKSGQREPKRWLCKQNNARLDPKFPRITQASFGLFQYWGLQTEWSNINVKPLSIDVKTLDFSEERNVLSEFWEKVRERIATRFFRLSR